MLPEVVTVFQFISQGEGFQVIRNVPNKTDGFVFFVLLLTDKDNRFDDGDQFVMRLYLKDRLFNQHLLQLVYLVLEGCRVADLQDDLNYSEDFDYGRFAG